MSAFEMDGMTKLLAIAIADIKSDLRRNMRGVLLVQFNVRSGYRYEYMALGHALPANLLLVQNRTARRIKSLLAGD